MLKAKVIQSTVAACIVIKLERYFKILFEWVDFVDS